MRRRRARLIRRWPLLAALAIVPALGMAIVQPLLRAQSPRPAQAPVLARPSPPPDPVRIRYPAGARPVVVLPDGTSRTIASLLRVPAPMRHGGYFWNDTGVPAGPVWVRVDLGRQILSVFRAGHEIGTAVILYGTRANPTPTGMFPVLEKARTHRSNRYEAEMPYMLRLTYDGVAIHGADVARGYASRGCIGVPLPFARELFDAVPRGAAVLIEA